MLRFVLRDAPSPHPPPSRGGGEHWPPPCHPHAVLDAAARLAQLDETLADQLDMAASASDATARTKLVAEAKNTMGKYAKYLASEPLLKDLDENPFLPLTIRATIGGTIQQLARIVT